jgi:hypothetical protein
MLAVYFLLGGNKVFLFCRAMVGGIGVIFAGAMMRRAGVVHIVVMSLLMLFHGHAHHRAMMVVRYGGERYQQKGGKRYGQYG